MEAVCSKQSVTMLPLAAMTYDVSLPDEAGKEFSKAEMHTTAGCLMHADATDRG